ncbi:Methyltransferase domain-containing protein [Cladophialophora immunda]|nr:Methyltransferase domain-containing protein [Cladophialophora immunda]
MASVQYPSPVRAPPHVLALLERLHQASRVQEDAIQAAELEAHGFDNYMRDKFIALDRDKAEFVYQVCLAVGAKTVVEAGTSFGVSTIYLALAVSENVQKAGVGKGGVVIATEYEKAKADKAREHWKEVGDEITGCIQLREGDILETLKQDLPEIDLLLLDIWARMALPVLKLCQPRMRRGAVVIADNTIGSADKYKDLLEYMRDPSSGFRNLTLPYTNGLEMSVYMP